MWKQNLEQRIQELMDEQQKERCEIWRQTLREELKILIRENTQVETEDKHQRNPTKGCQKTKNFQLHLSGQFTTKESR